MRPYECIICLGIFGQRLPFLFAQLSSVSLSTINARIEFMHICSLFSLGFIRLFGRFTAFNAKIIFHHHQTARL